MIIKASVALFCLLTLVASDILYTSPRLFASGEAANWSQFFGNGIFQRIDLSSLNLKKTPGISTSLECIGGCWTVTGVTSHHDVSPQGFTVYIRYPSPGDQGDLTLAVAIEYKFVLKYLIFPKE
jgi:hypothetical protein